jgi:2-keto-4-pentenoate hydratase/2-oxohepta-3-ene-1,7-dioic acid hydratase in catechol pathway
MKLLRYGDAGAEQPGIVDDDGALRSLAGIVNDITADVLSESGLGKLGRLDLSTLPLVQGEPRLGPCVADIGKMVCIGLNYSDHAAETNNPIPESPIIFMKATSAIVGPDDNVMLPRGSNKSDWEVELGIVIGKHAAYVTRDDALNYVAGYCVCNDVSERAFQIEGTGQWTKGKSCDTFGPVGPWMVTRDEVADAQVLDIWLELNGERVQDGNTRTMIFDVPTIVSYCSEHMSLQAGDIISTGTPPGVGMGMSPQRFLKAGDTMRLGIAGLGEQTQKVVAYPG